MKYLTAFIFTIILFLCNVHAQEKFNIVYSSPFGNASVSMIEDNDNYYVFTVTGENYSNELIGFYKIDSYGEMSNYITVGVENNYIFGGLNNLYRSKFCDSLISCGDLTNIDNYGHTLYISITDLQLNNVRIIPLDVDSAFTAYDITEINDSLFAIAIQRDNPYNFAGLVIFDKKNCAVIKDVVFSISGLETNGLFSTITKTTDNGFVMGGYTSAFGIGDFKKEWLVIKTDSVGTEKWTRHYGNPNENDGRIMAMLESKDSAYIVAGGQAICNWSMNPISEAALRKIDTAGNLIWEKFYRNYMYRESVSQIWFSDSYCADIIELEDGDFAGLYSFQKQSGSKRFMLIKHNSVGGILWTRRLEAYNSPGTCIPSSIKQTDDGGFILNGYGEFDTGQQFWLVKTDSLGNEGALYLAPPPENVECPDFPDTLYCNGIYNSKLRVQGKSAPYSIQFSTSEIIENLYYPPVFIPEIQGTGSFITYVGLTQYPQHYDTATIYTEIPSDDYIELPFSLSVPENYFGPDLTVTITNGFGESYEITLPVYVDCNVSNEQITESANINIYPNPASDFLQISLPQFEENSFVKIINAQGQSVLMEQLFNAETKLDINVLPAGSYIARIYCGNKIENLRFAKE